MDYLSNFSEFIRSKLETLKRQPPPIFTKQKIKKANQRAPMLEDMTIYERGMRRATYSDSII